jgi:hypothetical protein
VAIVPDAPDEELAIDIAQLAKCAELLVKGKISPETFQERNRSAGKIATFRWLTELGVLRPPEVDLASAERDEVTSALYRVLEDSQAVAGQVYETAEEARAC